MLTSSNDLQGNQMHSVRLGWTDIRVTSIQICPTVLHLPEEEQSRVDSALGRGLHRLSIVLESAAFATLAGNRQDVPLRFQSSTARDSMV